MANANFTTLNEALSIPQSLVEVILKFHKAGNSPEVISSSLGLGLPQVLQVLAMPTSEAKGISLAESFAKGSIRLRCAFSGKLMASPVIAPDKCLYDQSSIKSVGQGFFENKVLEVPYLKVEIQAFSKNTLQQLEFSSSQVLEDVLAIAAECLSVLNVQTEIESFLRFLTLGKDNLELALSKLREAVSEEGLLGLLTQLEDRVGFQLTSLQLIKELVQQPLHFEAVFGCFLRVLSQTALSSEALDLVEELKPRLDTEKLMKIIETLILHERDQTTQLKIDELKLNVAYLKREDKAVALLLLKSLYAKPEMKKKLEAFFEITGWKDEMTQYYQEKFICCLGSLGEPNLAEGLWSLFQFFSHKLEVSTDSQKQAYLAELDTVKKEIRQDLNEQSHLLIGHQSELRILGEKIRQQLRNEGTIRSENACVLGEMRQRTSEIIQYQTALQAQVKADVGLTLQSFFALRKQFQILDEKVQLQLLEEHKVLDQLKTKLVTTHHCLQAFEAQAQAEIGLINQTLDKLEEHCQRIEQRWMLGDTQTIQRRNFYSFVEPRSYSPDLRLAKTQPEGSNLPTYTYSYEYDTRDLHITNLKTGENTVKRFPSFHFKSYCSWCPLPPASLCFTGGDYPSPCKDLVIVDPINSSATFKAQMFTARKQHGSVYHRGFVYVLGGWIKECERYSVSEDRWTAIPPLPTSVEDCGVVTLEATQSIYVLGGGIDFIQELRLERLEWQTLTVKLPSIHSRTLAVFKVSEQECYFVQGSNLYVFSPSTKELRLVKSLSGNIHSYWGPSYYSNGTLYCSWKGGAARRLEIGSLS